MISIIIPVFNASDTLGECLTHVFLQQNIEDCEVIIIDDGSTDESMQIASNFKTIMISQINGGPAKARNHGAAAANGDVLVFLDADCVPTENWLFELTKPLSDMQIAGVRGAYLSKQKSIVPRFVQNEYQVKYDHIEKFQYIDFVDTYSASYRKSIFQEFGGFDTTYNMPSVEDQELSFRMYDKGYKLIFAPNAKVIHQHDKNIAEYFRRKFLIGFWKARLLQMHPHKAKGDSHTPVYFTLQIIFFVMWVISFFLMRNNPTLIEGVHLTSVLFLASCFPVIIHLIKHDPGIVFFAIPILVVRSLAISTGLFLGLFFRK